MEMKMNLKNNLFYYAASELSQDAFICWLASFALEDAEKDTALNECAGKLLTLFVPELKERPFALKSVERQVKHIDVLLTVVSGDTKYKIAVEDKTYTSEHDNQLKRYLETLTHDYPECAARGAYYKTWFQSDMSQVREAGYQIITTAQILDLMSPFTNRTDNRIFLDYYERLYDLHQNAFRYKTLPVSQWDTSQTFAFYDDLQNSGFAEERDMWIGYGYVSNPKGGFEGLWMGSNNNLIIKGVNCNLYLQIESRRDDNVKERVCPICLKLQPENSRREDRNDVRNAVVFDNNGRYRLTEFNFEKPARLACGEYMTIGKYTASFENAAQLKEALSAAFEDYRRLRDFLMS